MSRRPILTKRTKIRPDSEMGIERVFSRWYAEEGTGGRCGKCDRYFGSSDALEDHREYCLLLLKKKEEAVEKSGVDEELTEEDDLWTDGRDGEYSAWCYAETCLTHFNTQHPDTNYNLVLPGCYNIALPLIHLNFKAKPNDGPVETFFAQLKICLGLYRNESVVDCCFSLGASLSLPPCDSDSGNYGDCYYCPTDMTNVRHPVEECEGLDLGYRGLDGYVDPPSPNISSTSSDSES